MPTMVHWFVTREDFAEIRRISADPDRFGDDYDLFVKQVNDFLESTRNQGATAVKCYIKPSDLADWCRTKGRAIDSSARADYAVAALWDAEKDCGGSH